MVEESGLLPVTSLQSLGPEDKERLIGEGIIFCRELAERDIPFLSRDKMGKARKEALEACRSRVPPAQAQS
jgi:hypothetical protein